MITLAAIALTFFTAVALTALWRRLAPSCGLMDRPNDRSSHSNPTPRGAGVGFVVPILTAVASLWYSGVLAPQYALAILLAGSLIAMVGLIDDRFSLSARVRLCIHFAAAILIVCLVPAPPDIAIGPILLAWVPACSALAAVAVVWLINLTNFMDGTDGLAASEALFVTAALALLPEQPASLLMLVCAAAVGGFLIFNWPPARVFMGDAGSGFLGFLFGFFLYTSGSRARVAALILLALFITDATNTLLRRLYRGAPIGQAHRCHAYQHAAQHWGHRRVLLALWSVNLFWLAPLAYMAWKWPAFATGFCFIAYVPVLLVVNRPGACRSRACASNCPERSRRRAEVIVAAGSD